MENVTIKLHRPNLKEKVFFFMSGLIISIPFTFFFEQLSDSLVVTLPAFYANVLALTVFAPVIEEFAKAYPIFYRHGETERSIVTLGLFVGLGFGLFEFFSYTLFLGVPVLVRLPGIFFHAATTSVTAFGIAKKQPVRFYLLAVTLHFLNNLFALNDLLWLTGGILTIAVTLSLAVYMYQKTQEVVIRENF